MRRVSLWISLKIFLKCACEQPKARTLIDSDSINPSTAFQNYDLTHITILCSVALPCNGNFTVETLWEEGEKKHVVRDKRLRVNECDCKSSGLSDFIVYSPSPPLVPCKMLNARFSYVNRFSPFHKYNKTNRIVMVIY